MTRRVEVDFQVQEYEDGQPFIVIETLRSGDPMPEIKRKLIVFDVTKGMTLDEAKTLVDSLRRSITHLSITD
jgi:hypothetical protein